MTFSIVGRCQETGQLGVPRQHHTTTIRCPDRGEQTGFRALGIQENLAFNAKATQIALDEIDKLKIRIAADRRKTDQARENVPTVHIIRLQERHSLAPR